MRRLCLALLLVAGVAVFAAPAPSPKNVILFIADGAGPAHYTAMKLRRGADFQIGRMKVIGLATTFCANRAVTDSAAGATAIATGVKVNYEAVSLDAEGKPLPTVLEVAEKSGKVTGLVTTTYFPDATPAAFAAHAKHRDELPSIITQMLASGAELIVGGALKDPKYAHIPETAAQAGFKFINTRADLDAAPKDVRVLALFAEQTRAVDFPEAPLPDLTRWAINRLKGHPAGFFLMVEHEGTDSSSHQNNTADVNSSSASFDAAIGVALDFAAAAGDTLVVVTSDHETGGLRLAETKSARMRLEWSTVDHTAVAVPVFAFGPGSQVFAGFYDNTDIGKRLLEFVEKR